MSGLVTLLEQARGYGKLREAGWRPRRTLMFCVWDGEEEGLLGSTEWCETHAAELQRKAVAYLNSDGSSRGFLHLGGSHALETLAGQVAREVKDPQTGVTTSERLRAYNLVKGNEERRKLARERDGLYLNALGSGSDYTPFLQYLGIATCDGDFGGEANGGEYHTCFDTFDHFTRFGDPGFAYSLALTKVFGRLALRLTDAEILPWDFRGASSTYERYLAELVKLADDSRKQTQENNRNLADGLVKLAADPMLPFVAPEPKAPVPFLNFAPLQNAVDDLKAAAAAYQSQLDAHLRSDRSLPAAQLRELNRFLFQSERTLLSESGLPRRPWFRHQIYAPGYYTGYGVKTMPGVREGIEQRQWEETDQQIRATADALTRFTAQIRRASALLATPAN
jgi:N-acetylated-alpha-linked acidic dipeptidase